MMKILFLDFDGVMDTAYYDMVLTRAGQAPCDQYGVKFDPACVACLKQIIDETDARIVVTSTWKTMMRFPEFLAMWRGRDLPGTVIDTTPNKAGVRGVEIAAWLEECRVPCRYAIVDDLDASNFLDDQIPHLFVVNPWEGLDTDTTRRIIHHLNSES